MISEIHKHLPIEDYESLIRLRMAVPDKLAFEFDDLELIVIHFGDYSDRIVTVP